MKLEYVIDTLKLIIPENNNKNDDIILKCLEELEGDYYTFFHPKNLKELFDRKFLTEKQLENLLKLREMINNLQNQWSLNYYYQSKEWDEAKVLAKDILNSFNDI